MLGLAFGVWIEEWHLCVFSEKSEQYLCGASLSEFLNTTPHTPAPAEPQTFYGEKAYNQTGLSWVLFPGVRKTQQSITQRESTYPKLSDLYPKP